MRHLSTVIPGPLSVSYDPFTSKASDFHLTLAYILLSSSTTLLNFSNWSLPKIELKRSSLTSEISWSMALPLKDKLADLDFWRRFLFQLSLTLRMTQRPSTPVSLARLDGATSSRRRDPRDSQKLFATTLDVLSWVSSYIFRLSFPSSTMM